MFMKNPTLGEGGLGGLLNFCLCDQALSAWRGGVWRVRFGLAVGRVFEVLRVATKV